MPKMRMLVTPGRGLFRTLLGQFWVSVGQALMNSTAVGIQLPHKTLLDT